MNESLLGVVQQNDNKIEENVHKKHEKTKRKKKDNRCFVPMKKYKQKGLRLSTIYSSGHHAKEPEAVELQTSANNQGSRKVKRRWI